MSISAAAEPDAAVKVCDDGGRVSLDLKHIKGEHIGISMKEEPFLEDHFREDLLLPHLTVSTMSITFKLPVDTVDLVYISSNCELRAGEVCTIDFRGSLRTILCVREKKHKRRKSPNFYNSLTMEVAVCPPPVEKVMHFKLFKNGSVQAAGCQNVCQGNYAIGALLRSIQDLLGLKESIRDLKINLINVNFKLGHGVNRDNLHRLLLSLGELTTYEKCKHAGVGVKFLPEGKEKPISIFVFESGSVVITGSKNHHHIMSGYEFITSFVREHKREVLKLPTQKLLEKALAYLPPLR